MLSTATVTAVTVHVATNKTHKVGNLPNKPAPNRSWAAKGGTKCGTKGGRKRGHKGSSLNNLDFIDFPETAPITAAVDDGATGFVKVVSNELCSPLPPTKDHCKQWKHRAKGVKVPVHPAALKVQVSWTMIKMFNESTDVDFEFQRTKVDKLLKLCGSRDRVPACEAGDAFSGGH
jgi:hypothetical protein